MIVYKITTAAAWAKAQQTGRFTGSADDQRDGFVHLSSADQVADTLSRHFKDALDLLLVAFDELVLAPNLRWERSRNGELFPHCYGALATGTALSVRPLIPNELPVLDNEHGAKT